MNIKTLTILAVSAALAGCTTPDAPAKKPRKCGCGSCTCATPCTCNTPPNTLSKYEVEDGRLMFRLSDILAGERELK